MTLQINAADPLNVLASTKGVVENAQFVSINEGNFEKTAKLVKDRFGDGIRGQDAAIQSTGKADDDLQLIFLEDAVNFCFWADQGASKWQIEKADGALTTGGWYGPCGVLRARAAERVPDVGCPLPFNPVARGWREIFHGGGRRADSLACRAR
jgi:hypothetical protein